MVRKKLTFVDDVNRNIDLADYGLCFDDFTQIFKSYNWVYAIGKFGKISSPGISDIDGFLIIKDGHFQNALKVYDWWLETKNLHRYLFFHPPVIVTLKMLQYINHVHSLNSLKIIYNSKDIHFKSNLRKENRDFLNIAWTTYLISIVIKLCFLPDKISLRMFLLVLGNLHESYDNLGFLFNEKNRRKEKGKHLRTQILKSHPNSQLKVENEFYETLDGIFYFLSNFGEPQVSLERKTNMVRINKNMVVIKSNKSCITKHRRNLFNIYLNKVLFDQIFLPKDGPPLIYKRQLSALYKIYREEKVKSPLLSPFTYPVYRSKLYLALLNVCLTLSQINPNPVRLQNEDSHS